MEKSDLKNGDHFWALMHGKLVILIKTEYGYFACGAWECSIKEFEFEIISKIELPEGFTVNQLYYI